MLTVDIVILSIKFCLKEALLGVSSICGQMNDQHCRIADKRHSSVLIDPSINFYPSIESFECCQKHWFIDFFKTEK